MFWRCVTSMRDAQVSADARQTGTISVFFLPPSVRALQSSTLPKATLTSDFDHTPPNHHTATLLCRLFWTVKEMTCNRSVAQRARSYTARVVVALPPEAIEESLFDPETTASCRYPSRSQLHTSWSLLLSGTGTCCGRRSLESRPRAYIVVGR